MTNIIKDNDDALIKLPVKIVIRIAVFFGLNFKTLNLALPILEPNKSPNVEIKPPSNNKKIIRSQPDTIFFLFTYYIIKNFLMKNQLNLFESAIGSKTVIFFLSMASKPESRKSPNNLVMVTRVEPIASAIA